MNAPPQRAQFQAGLERAAHHWLACWQEHAHDHPALQAISGHALRSLELCAQSSCSLDLAIDLALAMHEHMWYQGQWDTWETTLQRLLASAKPAASSDRLFDLRSCLGAHYWRVYKLDQSLALLEENYRLAKEMRDLKRQGGTALGLAEANLNADAAGRALIYAEETAALGATLGIWFYQVDGLINSARALMDMDRSAEAEKHLQRAAALAEARDLTVYLAKARLFLGHVTGQQGRWHEALGHYQAALTLVTGYGDQVGQAVVKNGIGRALTALGRTEEAAQQLEEAVRIHHHHGNLPAERIALQRLQELNSRRPTLEELPA